MRNSSGMVTFQVGDGPGTARALAEHLSIIHYAGSLGHHRSLLFYIPTAGVHVLFSEQRQILRDTGIDALAQLNHGPVRRSETPAIASMDPFIEPADRPSQ